MMKGENAQKRILQDTVVMFGHLCFLCKRQKDIHSTRMAVAVTFCVFSPLCINHVLVCNKKNREQEVLFQITQ